MFNIIGTVLMVQLCKLLRSMGPSGLLSLYVMRMILKNNRTCQIKNIMTACLQQLNH